MTGQTGQQIITIRMLPATKNNVRYISSKIMQNMRLGD